MYLRTEKNIGLRIPPNSDPRKIKRFVPSYFGRQLARGVLMRMPDVKSLDSPMD
jgi:hypothetical protein